MADTPAQDRKLGLARERRPGGRLVTAFEPALALRIIEHVALGELLVDMCAPGNEHGFPSISTFYRWMLEQPDLAEAYNRAREISGSAFEEDAIRLTRAAVASGVPVTPAYMRALEAYVNQLRWSASRRDPRKFSERGTVSVTIPIQINSSLDLGSGVKGVSVELPNIYSIEAQHPMEIEGTFDEVPVPGDEFDLGTPPPSPVVAAIKAMENKPLKGWRAKQASKEAMEKRLAKRNAKETKS